MSKKEKVVKRPFVMNENLCMGSRLIDIEISEDGDCGYGQQVTLWFKNGGQLDIYVHPDGILHVEGD